MNKIRILDLYEYSNRIYVKLKKDFLKKLMKRAAKSETPYRNKDLLIKIKMKAKKVNSTVYSWFKKEKLPLNKLFGFYYLTNISLNELENNIEYLQAGWGGKRVYIKFPVKIDNKIGSIIGHILGDGSIGRNFLQICFTNQDKKLLYEFQNFMYKIFRIKPRIWLQEPGDFKNRKSKWIRRLNKIDEAPLNGQIGLFYPTFCALFLYSIFGIFAFGKMKRITKEIKNVANKQFKAGLIRAFYDDEGNVGQKNLRLFQDNKKILNSFREILLFFKIKAGNIKTYIKRNKERYYFDIYRKSNFKKFREEIGFTSPKKAKDLNFLSKVKSRYLYLCK